MNYMPRPCCIAVPDLKVENWTRFIFNLTVHVHAVIEAVIEALRRETNISVLSCVYLTWQKIQINF